MQHLDPDDLALLALGERLGDAVDAHVADCDACGSEIESFRTTAGLAELSNFGEDAPKPGEHVWHAIAAELGFPETEMVSGPVATASGLRSVPESGVPGPVTTHPNQMQPPSDSVPGSARSSSGRWSRWVAPLAAAIVGIAVGAGAAVWSQNRSDDATIEAVAPLKPVPDGPLGGDTGTLGEAELVAVSNGQQVRVTADQLPPSRDSYEVWLFGDDGRMVSLGTLNDRSGSFTVPQGINTQEYRVVDISDEAPDGNPAHSGISVIRGEFHG